MGYIIGRCKEEKLWEMEFEAGLKRPFETRINHSFIKTYKPIMDEEGHRIFERMGDYSRWCEGLPKWLGYGK
ncbi:MAG: hypothetical protein AB1630_09285 [bacterium]